MHNVPPSRMSRGSGVPVASPSCLYFVGPFSWVANVDLRPSGLGLRLRETLDSGSSIPSLSFMRNVPIMLFCVINIIMMY